MDAYLSKDYRQDCRYGEGCYQKNPEHKAKFKHPVDSDKAAKNEVSNEKKNVEEMCDKENKENVEEGSKKMKMSVIVTQTRNRNFIV